MKNELKPISVHELVYLEDKLQRYEKNQSKYGVNHKGQITSLRKQIKEAKSIVRDTKEYRNRLFAWFFFLLLATTQSQFDLTDELRRTQRTRTVKTAKRYGKRKIS